MSAERLPNGLIRVFIFSHVDLYNADGTPRLVVGDPLPPLYVLTLAGGAS